MCGIIGYIGQKQVLPILVNGLRRLEYRGYDSAGVVVMADGKMERVRTLGKIDNLAEALKDKNIVGSMGMAHTRWATHGGVTSENAHPHSDCRGKIMVVHNGIIENYRELRAELADHTFTSETDTEVLAHLIEKNYTNDLRVAVEKTLSKVRGTYGIVVMSIDEPTKMIVARLGSPIAIGVGEKEYYVASDTSPLLPYTQEIIFLEDYDLAEITTDNLQIFHETQTIKRSPEHIDWNETEAQKNGFAHFMLKEIFDQPNVIQDAMRGRTDVENGTARLGGLNMTEMEMKSIKKVVLLACGTSSYAAQIGKYAFESLARLPCEVEIASEFRYRSPIVDKETLVFALSQSGETADTLAALREAKSRGAYVRGIVNVIGSTIAREAGAGTYIHAGPELAVASTKAYSNMVMVLILYALQFGRLHGLSLDEGKKIVQELSMLPEKMKAVLEKSEQIKNIAEKYKHVKNFLFLGRGVNVPVAFEGALKLKEISYIHSEGLPGGEMKHGPIALLSSEFPVFGILTKNALYDKMRSNIEEVKARLAPIILVATEGDEQVSQLSPDIIFVPKIYELLEPLVTTLVFQLFAYYMAVTLGKDVDRPRNLAKSVTVE